ncbi:Putative Flp pilus-assembly TadE/G-like protein (plasmid) [Carboxydocella thermautotrophica]|nr:Putative Flp pilus-assembly TadE/G-like protein [Carboxydocella thermautotrophica]
MLKEQKGDVLIWTALLLPVFFLILGLITDLGAMYIVNRAVQTSLDAAATSAIDSAVIEESLLDESTEIKIDVNTARDNFYRLFKENMGLNDNLAPGNADSTINGPIRIETLDIRESGPPAMYVVVRVPIKTTIMHFLGDEDMIVKGEAVEEVFR